MKSIVLAAGYATRLYPLTENFPKPLLEVAGKSILDHLLDDIDTLPEIDEHIIISNHKFYHHFEEWKKTCKLKNPVTIIDDGSMTNETRLGAVKDIQFAIETLNLDDDLLIVAGDNLLDFSLGEMVKLFHEKNCAVVMCNYVEDVNLLRKRGVMIPDSEFRVISMEEKPQDPKSNWCVGPFYIYKREQLPLVKKGIEEGCGVDAPGSFISYLCGKEDVYALKMPGERYDIGDLNSYEEVKKIFAN
ncbi:MAG: nucleotidyltransferase family protein [Clostridia bacterium]|nr:nucleotidyltransferase family protein [Clostridia bacterium]